MVLEFVDNFNSNSNEFLFQISSSRFRLEFRDILVMWYWNSWTTPTPLPMSSGCS